MFRFARALAAGVAALTIAAFQAAPPQLPARLAALAEDAAAARSFDYMALKADGADLKALSNAVAMRTRIDGDRLRPLTEAETILQMELAAAAEAPTADAYEADRATANAAWDRWIAFGEAVMSGRPVAEPPFDYVAGQVRLAEEATDPRVRELLRRAALEQLLRRGWDVGDEVWIDPPPTPGARSRFSNRLGQQVWQTDRANTDWLKADIAANGWFLISVHGEAASGAAWLMAQHADHDRPFQRHVLTLLEPLVAAGEASASNFAYLYDRVAVGENRPQRYGTQGVCVAKGVWEPNTLENPERVQALRDEARIGSLAEYTTRMHRFCADFEG
ncbi:hypothetical protein N0B44_16665 [Roseibacterium beibuensis]|uniref:DUF6624 domain-containing protein n=1 Tax=[Roseibacterium] beibuensis TaxID=1193142 RepID=UPI00217E2A48|nr:DUF6624 domain-containing protein [Roseibacterium beibuensis]MCS6624551.1 hypothetical protein [Roseibacterium beibuensis]